MEDPPPFDEAIRRFQSFLSRAGISENLVWIFREDVVQRWHRIYIKTPLSDETPAIEQLYQRGKEADLGIGLRVFCLLAGRPCCYIYLPKDLLEAEAQMMPNCLRLNVPMGESRYTATPVGNGVRWAWLKWREQRSARPQEADDIPSRQPRVLRSA